MGADDQQLFRETIEYAQPRQLDLDVSGAFRLELSVEGTWDDCQDRLVESVWADPHLSR